MNRTDHNLTDALISGDRTAFKTAMDRFGPLVISIAASMIRDRRDVEEIVQDSFINVFRSINRFNPAEASLRTWIGRITFNRTIDFMRRHKYPEDLIDDTEALADIPEKDADDEISIEADIGLLKEAILSLRPKERGLLSMVYFDNMPLAEVAFILNSNPAALSARLYRLRHKLSLIINEKRKRL